VHLLIPAAGMGRRMGRNKLFLSLRSQPLITWTLLAAEGGFSYQLGRYYCSTSRLVRLEGDLSKFDQASAVDSGSHPPGICLQRFAGASTRSRASVDSRWS